MAFPSLTPTNRQFDSGNYPIKTFDAQSGAEVRILYGSQRTKMKLGLSFANVTDANAELFLDHFDEVKGSYSTFDLPAAALEGWEGTADALQASGANKWRYESAPRIASVRPGLSTVTVDLIGVL
jgi:hypothetical protein